MLKKVTGLCVFLALISVSVFAQLPYSKILDLTNDELKEKKFKFNSNRNLYSLSKKNGLNNVSNILSAVNGNSADVRPHVEDYIISLQKGADNANSSLSVVFYSDDAYHTISTWLAENNLDVIRTSSGKLTIEKFNYEGLSVELTTELVEIKTVTKNTFAAAKSVDESYNVYTYTIFTGVEPQSKWHTKEAEKRAKKKLKGGKQDLDDLL